MRILGIDPGLARVGYGVINARGGAQQMLDCGIIRTDSGRSEGDRMVEIAGDLRQLVRRWQPELAAVEKFFFYRSSNTISVVQARGVIIMTLARFGIPIVVVALLAQTDVLLVVVVRRQNRKHAGRVFVQLRLKAR